MKVRQEIVYLLELRSLCDILLEQARRLEEAATAWVQADADAHRALNASARHPTFEGSQTFGAIITEKTRQQGLAWLALEGFLGAWARASLLLWPAPSRSRPAEDRERTKARGRYLCRILGIDELHELNNRQLRNDWAHYDERLDDILRDGIHVTAQRFSAEPGNALTMRLIDLSNLRVTFAEERTADLRGLFAAARDLESRLQVAQDSISERHRAELLAQSE